MMALNWATAQSADNCTGGPTPGARALLAWGLETYPSTRSLGIYNCRTVRGGTTTSLHGEGRAVDQGIPLIGGSANPLGHRIIQRVGQKGKRLGLQRAIFDRQLWDARNPNGRYYGGTHPHHDHIHFELTWDAARNLTLATLRSVLGQEDDVLYLIRHGQGVGTDDGDPYVKYWQTRWKQMGYDLGDFGPNGDGVDGKYGDTGAAVVNRICAAAGLPQDGLTGFNVNAMTHFERRWTLKYGGGGGGGGITQADADKRYDRRGHKHQHDDMPHRHSEGRTGGPISM